MSDYINSSYIGDAGGSVSTAAYAGFVNSSIISIYGSADVTTDELDYYRITPSISGEYLITLSGLSSDIDLELLDQNGTYIAGSSLSSTVDDSVTADLVAGNHYYIEVDAFNGGSTYDLTVHLQDEIGSDYVNSVYIGDAGDTTAAATTAGFNSNHAIAIQGNASASWDEYDYYLINPNVSGTYEIALTGMSADLDLTVFDSAVSSLDSSSNGGSADDSITIYLNAGQYYYLEVDPFSTNESSYSLAVNPISLDTNYGYDYVNSVYIGDAGGDITTAAVAGFTSNNTISVYGHADATFDVDDYYLINPNATGTYQVLLSGLTEDLDLTVYDQYGTYISSSSSGGTSDDSLSLDLTSGINYYVKVHAYSSGSSDYDLSVSATSIEDSKSGNSFDGNFVTSQTFTGSSTAIDYVTYSGYYASQVSFDQIGFDSGLVSEDWTATYHGGSSKSGSTVTDYLYDIDRVQLDDYSVALDLDVEDNAGMALAILYAAFDSIPDADTLGYWFAQSDVLDSSTSSDGQQIIELAQQMIDFYAPNGVSHEALVNLLYANLFDAAPTPAVTGGFVNDLYNGAYSQADLLSIAAAIDINTNHYVDLIGNSVAYTEYTGSKMG